MTTETMTAERILAVCRSNWEYRGIDDRAVRDMLAELSGHLEDAAAAGRLPQDIVGDDVKAFAADWARARTPLHRRLLHLGLGVLSVTGTLLLLSHLTRWTGVVPVTPGRLAFYFSVGTVIVAVELRRGSLGLGKTWLVGLVVGLPSAILTDRLAGDEPLFRVVLWTSLLLVLPMPAYGLARRTRTRKRRPQAE